MKMMLNLKKLAEMKNNVFCINIFFDEWYTLSSGNHIYLEFVMLLN